MIPYKNPHNSSKRILAFKMAHPTYTTSRLAKVLNLRYRLVYNTLYTYKALGGADTLAHVAELIKDYQPKPNSKLAFDLQKKEETTSPTKGQEILREVIAHSDGLSNAVLRSEKASLHAKIDELEILVKAMKTQMRGLENVIQYLEAKLGIDEIDARLESTKD
jgi:hypothetical protein